MKIGITMGDPSGIGPEVIIKAMKEIKEREIVVIGVKSVFDELLTRHKIDLQMEIIEPTIKGNPSPANLAFSSLLLGYNLISGGEISALVTAPVCKKSINQIYPSFKGHTEFLASLAGVEEFAMMLMGEKIRVTLVTTHLPLKEVRKNLTLQNVFSKIKLTHSFLSSFLQISSPLIGVCALNPHAGEGILGDAEEKVILPAIRKAKEKGIRVEGPISGDVIFRNYEKYDSIIAMYHDQGLIPLKLLEFGGSVNITLGLPFIRTSPDHGTAFDIKGKWIANPSSMVKAIKLASLLEQHRH